MAEEGKLTVTLLKPKLTGTLATKGDTPPGELHVFAGGKSTEEAATAPESPYKDSAGRGIKVGDKITLDKGDDTGPIKVTAVGFIEPDNVRGIGVKCLLPDRSAYEWHSNDRFGSLVSDSAIEREGTKGKASAPIIADVTEVSSPLAEKTKPQMLGGTLRKR